MITDYQWIDDNSELEQLILSLNNSDVVAFDSEFERVNTFYPKAALFQLKIKQDYYLIDMKEISKHEIFVKLLDNIILHSGSEDLEILYNLNQQLPATIFDTQIAASLCGFGLHFSYQNIVKELLGVELSKALSRSDWMRRPLSDAQLKYALEDVVYLPELKEILVQKLVSENRMPWYKLLIKQRTQAIMNSNYVDKLFVKLNKSNRFNQSQQKLLYTLLNWREVSAKQRDKPRQWLLKNQEIVDIIYKKPTTPTQLIDDIGLYPKFVKYNAEGILSLYQKSEELDDTQLPLFDKLSANQGDKFAQVKQQLSEKCEQLDIPSALVINTADLKSLIAADKDLSSIDMWQMINQ
jgi:ribonuclease D